MTESLFELEKYAGIKTRHRCPACRKQGEFTKYINKETGQYLADHVGRCNRVEKCNYHFTPKDYLTDNPTEKPAYVRPQSVNKYDHIPQAVVEKSLGVKSSRFHEGMHDLFEDADLVAMNVGTSRDGKTTVFFYQDYEGRYRTGKAILFNRETLKRDRSGGSVPHYIHRKVKEDFNYRATLFGEHLITPETKKVCIVEAEKTAVICTIALNEDCVWLATGGSENFKWTQDSRRIQLLTGKEITLFPDTGFYEKWKEKANSIGEQCGLSMNVSELLERPTFEKGSDIADHILKEIIDGRNNRKT